MIADLKPYPAMKDSGVEWLGAVPEHWEVRRLRNTSEMRVSNVDKHAKDDEQPVRLCNYVDVYKNERIRSGMAFMRATATTDEIERFRLQSGDVLITKDSEAWNDIGVPALVEDTQDDIVSGYHLALLRPFPERVDGGYLFRALQSTAVTYQFHVEANGVTRYGLSHSAIKSVWLPLAPLPEQAAIVRFLDHADRRIRRYIHAKQKLVKLLEEQKQAVIHRAVTGQIDVRTGKPYPAYKDSRVEWLGRIPQRWRAVSLGRLTLDRCDGPFGSGLKSSHYTDEGIRVVRLQNIGHGTFNDEDTVYIAPEHYATLGDHSVQPGDLLIAGLGDPHHPAGRACVAPTNIRPAMVKADCFRFRVDQEAFLPAFAALQLTATAHAASAVLSTGATRQRTNLQSTTGRHVVVPSKSEQARVVEYCTGEKARLDAVQQAAGREILLLGAYRTRLIADVVTGKLDVREAAARLPDEVEELEPLDEADALIDGEEEPTDALATAP